MSPVHARSIGYRARTITYNASSRTCWKVLLFEIISGEMCQTSEAGIDVQVGFWAVWFVNGFKGWCPNTGKFTNDKALNIAYYWPDLLATNLDTNTASHSDHRVRAWTFTCSELLGIKTMDDLSRFFRKSMESKPLEKPSSSSNKLLLHLSYEHFNTSVFTETSLSTTSIPAITFARPLQEYHSTDWQNLDSEIDSQSSKQQSIPPKSNPAQQQHPLPNLPFLHL